MALIVAEVIKTLQWNAKIPANRFGLAKAFGNSVGKEYGEETVGGLKEKLGVVEVQKKQYERVAELNARGGADKIDNVADSAEFAFLFNCVGNEEEQVDDEGEDVEAANAACDQTPY